MMVSYHLVKIIMNVFDDSIPKKLLMLVILRILAVLAKVPANAKAAFPLLIQELMSNQIKHRINIFKIWFNQNYIFFY